MSVADDETSALQTVAMNEGTELADETSEISAAQPTELAEPSGAPRRRWWHLDFAGVVGALLLIGLAMTPSLLPRPALFQGVIAGVSAAIGYDVRGDHGASREVGVPDESEEPLGTGEANFHLVRRHGHCRHGQTISSCCPELAIRVGLVPD